MTYKNKYYTNCQLWILFSVSVIDLLEDSTHIPLLRKQVSLRYNFSFCNTIWIVDNSINPLEGPLEGLHYCSHILPQFRYCFEFMTNFNPIEFILIISRSHLIFPKWQVWYRFTSTIAINLILRYAFTEIYSVIAEVMACFTIIPVINKINSFLLMTHTRVQ